MNALMKSGGDLIRNLDDLKILAGMLVKSGLLPSAVRTPEAAAAIILKGREVGMPVMESFALINVIQGKPTIAPQGMLALARRSRQLEDIKIRDDGETCTVALKRVGEEPHTTTFSQADAAAMGLAGKDNWKKQPAVMRQWRAVSAACRIVFPDVIGGMYTPEELGADVDAEGEIVDAPNGVIERERELNGGGNGAEPIVDDRTRWAAFVAQTGATLLHIQAALGVEKVSEWLAADPARTLDDAIGLVEQQVTA